MWCSPTCVQSLWSWWSRGWGWASSSGWSGGWGAAFCLTYRARNTPKNTEMESLSRQPALATPPVHALLPEGQRSSLTVRLWGKSKRSCFWLGAASVVLEWLWMELKSLGWWRPSCCSFSGFCVSVAENSSFCSGIWGGDRLSGHTHSNVKALSVRWVVTRALPLKYSKTSFKNQRSSSCRLGKEEWSFEMMLYKKWRQGKQLAWQQPATPLLVSRHLFFSFV